MPSHTRRAVARPAPHRLTALPVLLTALACLSAPAWADTIYRWKDASGQVHLSDRPPPDGKAERIELPKTQNAPPVPVKPAVQSETKPPDSPSGGGLIEEAPAAKPASEAKEKTCAERWAEYFKSQECFAPYQRVNGGLKEGAYEHCVEVPNPGNECEAPKEIPQ